MATLFYFNADGLVTGVIYPDGSRAGTLERAVKFVPVEDEQQAREMIAKWRGGKVEMAADNVLKIDGEPVKEERRKKTREQVVEAMAKMSEEDRATLAELVAADFLLANPTEAKRVGIDIFGEGK
jgi:hypothetical protein